MKRYKCIAVLMAASMMMTSCGKSATLNKQDIADTVVEQEEKNTSVINMATDKTIIDTSDVFTDRDMNDEYDESECEIISLADGNSVSNANGVIISGDIITINKEGKYILSGELSNGCVVVDADEKDKIQLILNKITIKNNTTAPMQIKSADKVFITLAEGTENVLINDGEFTDEKINSVIYSKKDISLNGKGSLLIKSSTGNGIVCKDDLRITNGIYNIDVAGHGINGKDSVAIADGVFDIKAGKDAIQSSGSKDEDGWVYIQNGEFNIEVGSDGISALNEIQIIDGKIDIKKSYEGIEARLINIIGGDINIVSEDDGFNATDKRGSQDTDENSADNNSDNKKVDKKRDRGDFKPEDFENGEMPDFKEGERPKFENGEMPDFGDGKRPDFENGEKPDFKEGEMPDFGKGGPMFDTDEEANINICGGVIRINAEGDGFDSNGYATVSGGELYVTGPSNGGNGALDYGIDATITGGIVVAAGQSSMAVNFGKESTQGSILVNCDEQQAAGSDIVLLDSDGKELIKWTMEKKFNSVVISSPAIVDKGKYTLKMGNYTEEIIMDGLLYGKGGFGFGGGMPSQMPDFNGEKPEIDSTDKEKK